MTFSKQTRLAILFMSTVMIGACTADTSLRARVESYLDENISELSPRTATRGEFRVRTVEWIDDDSFRVTYADEAGVALRATGDVDEAGIKLVTNFRIDTSTGRSSSSASLSHTSESSSAVSSPSTISSQSSATSASSTISDDDGISFSAGASIDGSLNISSSYAP